MSRPPQETLQAIKLLGCNLENAFHAGEIRGHSGNVVFFRTGLMMSGFDWHRLALIFFIGVAPSSILGAAANTRQASRPTQASQSKKPSPNTNAAAAISDSHKAQIAVLSHFLSQSNRYVSYQKVICIGLGSTFATTPAERTSPESIFGSNFESADKRLDAIEWFDPTPVFLAKLNAHNRILEPYSKCEFKGRMQLRSSNQFATAFKVTTLEGDGQDGGYLYVQYNDCSLCATGWLCEVRRQQSKWNVHQCVRLWSA